VNTTAYDDKIERRRKPLFQTLLDAAHVGVTFAILVFAWQQYDQHRDWRSRTDERIAVLQQQVVNNSRENDKQDAAMISAHAQLTATLEGLRGDVRALHASFLSAQSQRR
jgi:hypothetical protein